MQACHFCHVAHCDLKLENVMLTQDNKVKLIDFGNSMKIAPGEFLRHKGGGVACFQPCEPILGKPWSNKRDCWGWGIIVLYLFGFPVFYEATFQEVEQFIKKNKFVYGKLGLREGKVCDYQRDLESRLEELSHEERAFTEPVLQFLKEHVFVEERDRKSSDDLVKMVEMSKIFSYVWYFHLFYLSILLLCFY